MKYSKVIILGIFSIVFFSIYSHSAYAELESLTPLELYTSSELILVGNVVSLREDSEQRETEYDIKVEQYLKNPKPFSMITVVGAGTKGTPTEDDPLFDHGDRVLLYLNKHDEKYRIRPFSFKAPLTCDGHQLLQLATIPGEPRGISSPVRDLIHLTNTFGIEIDTFVVNDGINIDYDLFNNNPQSNSVEVEIAIITDSATVFHANQSIPLEPCTNTIISWNFTPTKTGEYTVNVTSEDISTSTDFNVKLNRVGVSLDKNTLLSPLKQIKEGVSLVDVKCNEGKVPAYKYNRMSVACVSLDTESKLVLRGWATMRLAMPDDNIPQALCNNYEGIWHPEYNACRGISDLQCSLIGGHFESLRICSGDICPNKPHSMCVTNPDALIQSDAESQVLDLSKITFMKPNSIVFFYYPDPSDIKDRDAYETFMLVRLPEWLGGNSDDASAFRAYSAKAVDDSCLVKYWPQEGRQIIENPCRGGFYRIVDGAMIRTFGAVPGGAPIALPHLTLSFDENGFLYIEPPIWSKTDNGVLGFGREITLQEIREGSMFLIDSFEKAYPDYPEIPLEFAGMTLADITPEYDQRFKVFYSEFTPIAQNIEMFITKCDCDTLRSHSEYDDIENIGGTVIAIHDEKSRNPEISDSFNSYTIKFAKDGFEFEVIGKNLDFMKSSIAANFLNEN